jgi:hypothetical protein
MKRLVILGAAFLLLSARALASGMSGHMLMTDLAIAEVADPELRSFLVTHHDALLCGCIYPDSGFTLRYTPQFHGKWDYGEDTHLPTFIEAYLAHVRASCPGAPEQCGDLAAHFLGAGAHVMEDELYDEILIPRAIKIDFDDEPFKYDHDVAIDVLVIKDHKLWAAVPKWFTPASDLVEVYSGLGLSVKTRDIILGNRLLKLAVVAERGLLTPKYYQKKTGAPWFAENYDAAPGGMEFNGRMVARFWETLWQRLKGGESAGPLLAVYPEDGAEMMTDEEIHAVFSKGVEDPDFTPESFFLRDQDQHPVAGCVRTGRTPFGSSALVATFKPASPLIPGASYTATLTTAIHDLEGAPLPADFTWRFIAVK